MGELTQKFKQSWRMLTMVFALVVIWCIFQYMTDGAFLQSRNLSNLFRQMTVTGTLAIAMVLIIIAGHIDLSVGSVVCFLGVILTILMQRGWSPESALLATFGVGILIGGVQGYLTAYQKVPAFIVTLGGMMVFRGASMGVTQGVTIPLADGWIKTFGSAYLGHEAGWVLTIATVAVFAGIRFNRYRINSSLGVQAGGMPTLLASIGLFGVIACAFIIMMNGYEGIPYPVLLLLSLTLCFHFIATKTVLGGTFTLSVAVSRQRICPGSMFARLFLATS